MRPLLFILPLLVLSAACNRAQECPPDPKSLPSPTAKALSPEGLSPEVTALLLACQDATYGLKFDRAEALAAKAIALMPRHPLPRIFMQMAVLARIQEAVAAGDGNPELFARFDSESAAALLLAKARELSTPDGYSQLYLGSCLGAMGLVKMLQGHYLKAYHDGQAASAALHLATTRDPRLCEAYLGLGQYDYYCGRMAGLLRFVARLHGNIHGGIAMLETCGLKGGYAATAARITLARIYSLEETDFPRALPYVAEIRRHYPNNYSYVQYAAATAKGLGWMKPQAEELLESVFKQWDQGWRPPPYAKLELEPLRLDLARAYIAQRRMKKALPHLNQLAMSKDRSVARAAQSALKTLLKK